MTLDQLRKQFWWLGPDGSYVSALHEDLVTLKVLQVSWVRRTQPYEEAVARDFQALGLRVRWELLFVDELEAEITKAREASLCAGKPFDRALFIDTMRNRELASLRP